TRRRFSRLARSRRSLRFSSISRSRSRNICSAAWPLCRSARCGQAYNTRPATSTPTSSSRPHSSRLEPASTSRTTCELRIDFGSRTTPSRLSSLIDPPPLSPPHVGGGESGNRSVTGHGPQAGASGPRISPHLVLARTDRLLREQPEAGSSQGPERLLHL